MADHAFQTNAFQEDPGTWFTPPVGIMEMRGEILTEWTEDSGFPGGPSLCLASDRAIGIARASDKALSAVGASDSSLGHVLISDF